MRAYNRIELEKVARETGFIRDNLEKVIRLSNILEFLVSNDNLKGKVVLKGGTAINLTVFDMPRLSVDIDLDYCCNSDKERMMTDRAVIGQEILGHMQSNGYTLHPSSKNTHALDSWVFSYLNAGGNRDNIKIEINYMMRVHILEPLTRKTSIPFIEGVDVYTVAPLELFGSKIKALVERAAPRDLYDINRMIKENIFKDDQMDMLRKIVVFYLAVGGKEKPKNGYSFEKIQNIRFPQIRSALIPVLKKSERFDFEEAKANVISFLSKLLIMGESENNFINLFNQGEYKPEALFDNPEIIDRIKEHPMALWKMNEI
ncbi:MAG: nucleotidyl transferase AbiEii/AbiGii toxin family protein [Bacteroidales bacterium]|nr:nucleotidyl transferase AbiEii/AbiGii toxin family protein [Bacteroidales bacterium]